MKIIYPAIFHEEDGAYWVEFPDIEGCFSDGETIGEVLENSKEALSAHCESLIEDGQELARPTPIKDIKKSENSWVSFVEAEVNVRSKSVKKTLTIPVWLNEMAEAKGVNFSSILQNALLKELDIIGKI